MGVLRIALLVCDAPPRQIYHRFGHYAVWFTQLFTASLGRVAPHTHLALTAFNVKANEYPLSYTEFDGIVITGSAANAYDDDPWIVNLVDYIKTFHTQAPDTCRMIGVCFGHQVIARAFGTKVEKNVKGWEAGWTEIEVTEACRNVFETDKGKFTLQQMHQDHVVSTPNGFQLLATTEKSSIQSLLFPNRIFTVQAHPEFYPELVGAVIKRRHKLGIFSDEFANNALANVGLKDDSPWFADIMTKFLLRQHHATNTEPMYFKK